jgi:drug/metabolite transporter (DMT)-like permease
MQLKQKQERVGEKFLISYMILYALAPILANYTAKNFQPILVAAVTTLITAVALFFILAAKRQMREIFNKKAFGPIFGNTMFNIVVPLALIFVGTSKTSAINTTLLHQTELLFAFLVSGLFYGEMITRQKLVGGTIVLLGTIAVLYNGTFELKLGDLLIIAGTALYPFGNHYAKQALLLAQPSIVLFLRTIMGGIMLLMISFVLEGWPKEVLPAFDQKQLALFAGLILGLLGIAKLLWFEGLKRLDVSKSTAIVIAGPAFSLVYAVALLHEIPTLYQLAGMLIIIAGLFILMKQKMETPTSSPL